MGDSTQHRNRIAPNSSDIVLSTDTFSLWVIGENTYTGLAKNMCKLQKTMTVYSTTKHKVMVNDELGCLL